MRLDPKTYLILSTLVAGSGLALIYFRHRLYEWLFPIPADFADGTPPPSSVRFEGTLGRALLPLAKEVGLTLLFGALAGVTKDTTGAMVFAALAVCLLGKSLHSFRGTITRRPVLELNPQGLSYWPGHGAPTFWRWEEIRSVETRRALIVAQEDRWEHAHRFTHLILHHASSRPNPEGQPLGFEFPWSKPDPFRLVIALSVLGPPPMVAKILARYRHQVSELKRQPVRHAS